ncbi:MAG: RloB family protein [Bacteroidales bacterium]|nr:RloB family protein [Bacteroidales bacterium]
MPKPHEEKLPIVVDTDVTLSSAVTGRLKGYEKTDGVMSYSIVCVISGGEKRERDFLLTLIRQQDLHSLRVAFISKEGQGLHPYQMQEKWEEIRRTKIVSINDRTFHLDDMDKVFLLSDVDEFYEQLVKIHEGHSEEDSGQWIISNPCFEVWLYYCFCNKPEEDLISIESLAPQQRSQEMKQLGHTVIAGGLNSIKAFEHMQEGIAHSVSHYAEDDNAIPVLFATQMHQMAQFLIDTMNHHRGEYDEFVRRKQEQRQEWRRMMMKSGLDSMLTSPET